MPLRPPIRAVLLALAVIGLGAGLRGQRADALDVVASFTIPQLPAVVDLNGPAAGTGYAASFYRGSGAAAIVDPALMTLTDPIQTTVASATVTITNLRDGAAESLSANVAGTAIVANYDATTGRLTLTGTDTVGNYQLALRTLVYDDSAATPDTTDRLITVVVNDGALDSAPATSVVAVVINNNPPTLDPLADFTILEDAGVQTVPLAGIGTGGEAQTLTVTATSSNPALMLNPQVTYSSPNATGSLQLATISNRNGSAVITVTVRDSGGASCQRQFTVTVTAVNDAPTLAPVFDPVANPAQSLTILENASQQTVSLTGIGPGGGPDEAGQAVTITASSSNPNLIDDNGTNPANPGRVQVFYAGTPAGTATLEFTPNPGQSGTATIFVVARDNGGVANGGFDTVVRAFTVNVQFVNQGPVQTVNAGLSLPVGQTRTVDQTLLAYSDDRAPEQITFTLTAVPTSGTLRRLGVALGNGGTFTQKDINSGLIAYTHTGVATGSDGFDFGVADGDGGVGVPSPAHFAITITPVNPGNQPPMVSLPGPTQTFVEGGGALAVDATATVDDADGTLANGSLTLSFTSGGSVDDRLGFRNQGTAAGQIGISGTVITYSGATIGTFGGGTGLAPLVVNLGGNAPPAAVQALLRTAIYDNVSQAPSTADRIIQVVANDGAGGLSSPVSTRIAVLAVNTPPVLTFPQLSIAYVEGSGPTVLDGTATVDDVDSPDFTGGSLTLTLTTGASSADRLAFRNQGNGAGQIGVSGNTISYAGAIIGTFTGGSGAVPLAVSFFPNVTPAIVQQLLRDLTFDNISSNPSTATRTVTALLDDGDGGVSAPAAILVVMIPVDDAPVVTLPSGTLTYAQGSGGVAIDALATVADVDSATFPNGLLRIDFTSGATASDLVDIPDQGSAAGQIGVSGSTISIGGVAIGTYTGAAGVSQPLLVSLNANATPALVQVLLRGVTFTDNAAVVVAGPRTIAVTLTDGVGGTSIPATKTIDLVAVNRPPVVGLAAGGPTYVERAAPVALDPAATLSDVDSPSFSGATLAAGFSGGGAATDRLAIADTGVGLGQTSLIGAQVLFQGTVVGTFTGGGSGTTLLVTFNAAATPAVAQGVLRNVVFDNPSHNPGGTPRVIQVVVSDNLGAASAPQSRTVTVIPVNDAPVAQDATFITVPGVAISDLLPASDPENDALTWTLLSAPTQGTVTLLDAATGSFRYTPAANMVGVDTFTFRVDDGLLDSNIATVTMRMTDLESPRPHSAADPPREIFVGEVYRYDVIADTSELGGNVDLAFRLTGTVPAGMTLTKTGLATATLQWTATIPASAHRDVGVLFSDPISGQAGFQPVQVLVRPVPQGGG